MALKVRWTKRASIRFDEIIESLESNWGEKVTQDFVLRTYSIVELLIENPNIGKVE
jgi:plasmid stabilization system protein ParE